MRPLIAALVTLAVVFAGCATDEKKEQDAGTGDTTPPLNNTTAAPQVERGTGSVTVSGGVLTASQGGLTFAVAENATLLFAEIAWDDEVQDLDLGLSSPAAQDTAGTQEFDHLASGGAPGAPDSPHSLTIESPLAGEWYAAASANGASGPVEYRVAVTVFFGETTVPEGYTAL